MNILVTICARGGSKGIPGKNIRDLNGKPLIAYSIETARNFSKRGGNVVVGLSTDSNKIKETAAKFGLETSYTRPAKLGTDEAGKIEVIKDLKNYEEATRKIQFDYVLDLDVTSPLRTVQDLEGALSIIENDKEAFNIFSVNPANRSPYFNMVEEKDNGYFGLVKPLENPVFTRQSAPKVFDMNASFYFFRKSFFDKGFTTSITKKSLIYEMSHICFDLDHPSDFTMMELLLKNSLLEFKL